MQYVRSISGSVSKTWNSINPATLSGAIDVIVVEQEDGTRSLACSPFHVRFGKFSLLRPYEKKVEFRVNDVKQDYSMKLGEGGEAFFVFETTDAVPESLQTSPLVSPAASPEARPTITTPTTEDLPEPEPLDLANASRRTALPEATGAPDIRWTGRESSATPGGSGGGAAAAAAATAGFPLHIVRSNTDDILPSAKEAMTREFDGQPDGSNDNTNYNGDRAGPSSPLRKSELMTHPPPPSPSPPLQHVQRSASPPPVSKPEAVSRAINLSKKLWTSNIPTQVTDGGDLMLDMTGYKSSEEEALRAEVIARRILAEELEGNYDIGALIGADVNGNLWIYSSEEAKEQAQRRTADESARATPALQRLHPAGMLSSDAISDPGYHSDENQSDVERDEGTTAAAAAATGVAPGPAGVRRDSDSALGLSTPPKSPAEGGGGGGSAVGDDSGTGGGEAHKNYAKTLRLTSEQLRAMGLRPGENTMSFSVNRATCTASIWLWRHDVPIVISDIDGTITKSDALGHVLNMIGRDWTHLGVAKLYTDIAANGYNILYLTSRSVGQADTTRAYLNGVLQDGYRLPRGPVIMSPDRTMAALRREIYLRKPEVFKMACLRDIASLFASQRGGAGGGSWAGQTPFYAGFGNRLTDALSYRSVRMPSTRIFTINSNAEVSLDLLSLNRYKTGYVSMRELVDHFFPPLALLVQSGGEDFTDFNYWRERPLELDEFSASEESDEGGAGAGADGHGEGGDADADADGGARRPGARSVRVGRGGEEDDEDEDEDEDVDVEDEDEDVDDEEDDVDDEEASFQSEDEGTEGAYDDDDDDESEDLDASFYSRASAGEHEAGPDDEHDVDEREHDEAEEPGAADGGPGPRASDPGPSLRLPDQRLRAGLRGLEEARGAPGGDGGRG
ncbi:Lipin/Ned1/Smp2-domain-containing protein [Lineolata rhizophorae]|uniref:Lipin/Ned1/Smp2-domain-containing protein n=1 Tax=Lineolata rhizophorae TaxID=578093 RepID=A0A6A6NTF9_9PEZI|nr:Lipin/Ned1/Smp2-domain-containing protein [Lineolata rhizophorae]